MSSLREAGGGVRWQMDSPKAEGYSRVGDRTRALCFRQMGETNGEKKGETPKKKKGDRENLGNFVNKEEVRTVVV